jgi:hypothetical protein
MFEDLLSSTDPNECWRYIGPIKWGGSGWLTKDKQRRKRRSKFGLGYEPLNLHQPKKKPSAFPPTVPSYGGVRQLPISYMLFDLFRAHDWPEPLDTFPRRFDLFQIRCGVTCSNRPLVSASDWPIPCLNPHHAVVDYKRPPTGRSASGNPVGRPFGSRNKPKAPTPLQRPPAAFESLILPFDTQATSKFLNMLGDFPSILDDLVVISAPHGFYVGFKGDDPHLPFAKGYPGPYPSVGITANVIEQIRELISQFIEAHADE